jgi:hypothetical protein
VQDEGEAHVGEPPQAQGERAQDQDKSAQAREGEDRFAEQREKWSWLNCSGRRRLTSKPL